MSHDQNITCLSIIVCFIFDVEKTKACVVEMMSLLNSSSSSIGLIAVTEISFGSLIWPNK